MSSRKVTASAPGKGASKTNSQERNTFVQNHVTDQPGIHNPWPSMARKLTDLTQSMIASARVRSMTKCVLHHDIGFNGVSNSLHSLGLYSLGYRTSVAYDSRSSPSQRAAILVVCLIS